MVSWHFHEDFLQPVHFHRQPDLRLLVEFIANAPEIGNLADDNAFGKNSAQVAGDRSEEHTSELQSQ